LLFVHSKPFLGNSEVKVAITNRGYLQLFLNSLRTGGSNVMLDSPIDEEAALAWLGHAVNGADGMFWQDDINAFCHGMLQLMILFA
jgi:hypothetical protein